jgi:AAA+ ATPase superfamily predicted ATPase
LYSHEFKSTYCLGDTRDYHHINLRSDVTQCSQSFNSELPNGWENFLKAFNLSKGAVSWTLIEPGKIVPIHQDFFVNLRKDTNVPVENCIRYIIMLEDWQFGQVLEFNNQSIRKWKQGDAWMFDSLEFHWAANASNYNFYSCQVSSFRNV